MECIVQLCDAVNFIMINYPNHVNNWLQYLWCILFTMFSPTCWN